MLSTVSHELFPMPLEQRIAEGRPVMSREQALALVRRIQATRRDPNGTFVEIVHTVQTVTRIANGQILSSDDGEAITANINLNVGTPYQIVVSTNQFEEDFLSNLLDEAEHVAFANQESLQLPPRSRRSVPQITEVDHWFDTTVQAMTTSRANEVPDMVRAVSEAGLVAGGFVAQCARAQLATNSRNIEVFHEETDAECTLSARPLDLSSSAWWGTANRDWSAIDTNTLVSNVIELARKVANPVGFEPGRRVAILSPFAVAELMRHTIMFLDAWSTDGGNTPYSKPGGGNRLQTQVIDSRISVSSNPADPEGGFVPFARISTRPDNPRVWIENGVLRELRYSHSYALERGKPSYPAPQGIRMSGGSTSVEEMIAQCESGIYVRRFSGTSVVDGPTGMMSGVTRDGCFHIRDGKIDKPVKNFRFLESPFFILNSVIALGPPTRAALGFAPGDDSPFSWYQGWPAAPIVVPPVMVRDFNFVAIADAV